MPGRTGPARARDGALPRAAAWGGAAGRAASGHRPCAQCPRTRRRGSRGLPRSRGRPRGLTAMPTGASPTSRPTASTTPSSSGCRRRKAPATGPDRYQLCFALGKALEDRGRYAESFALLRARQCAAARRRPLPARSASSGSCALQIEVCTAELFARTAAAAPRTPTRSSSSACRARARRSSSRSWPRTPRSRARTSSPTSRAWRANSSEHRRGRRRSPTRRCYGS